TSSPAWVAGSRGGRVLRSPRVVTRQTGTTREKHRMVAVASGLRRVGAAIAATLLALTTVGAVGADAQIDPAVCILCAGGEFFPVAPQRILDTRNGTGGRVGALPFGQALDVAVAGVAGVPGN